jgi:hypothetical protein
MTVIEPSHQSQSAQEGGRAESSPMQQKGAKAGVELP